MGYSIRFNQEEIDKINRVYQEIISYIDQFIEENNLKSTKFSVGWLDYFVEGCYRFDLEIKGRSIKLTLDDSKKKFDMRKVNNVFQQLEIIGNYNTICESLSDRVKESSAIKRYLQEEKKASSAQVAVQFPESIDQHTIEIKEEDGRVVGTIDFGGKLIKIITDGDIVLDDQRDRSKAKIK